MISNSWDIDFNRSDICGQSCKKCFVVCVAGAGVQWNNMDQGVSVDDNFALLHVIMMLLVDTVLYAIITWYVEAVRPGEYGIPQPWYFPLTVSFFRILIYLSHEQNNDIWLAMNNKSFWSQVVWLGNNFHEWCSHEWKLVANHPM